MARLPEICTTCGKLRTVEYHHVARRLHSQGTACQAHCVTVPVCVPCHRILTIWDAERTWPQTRLKVRAYSQPWGNRLVAGSVDIFRLAALREETGRYLDISQSMLDTVRRSFRFAVRPSQSLPEIDPVDPDDAMRQVDLLNECTEKVFAVARVRVSFGVRAA